MTDMGRKVSRGLKKITEFMPYSASPMFNQVEFLNAVFILTILLLHHGNYTFNALWLLRVGKITPILQKLAVGGFLFLSGYKLKRSKSRVRPREFIRNRFLRIYLLYLVALIFFSFSAYPFANSGNLPSWQNFVLHALCLQALVPGLCQNLYQTVWFVSVLFWCYLFFLISRDIVKRPAVFMGLALAQSILVVALRFVSARFGIELFIGYLNLFLFCFALGMIYSMNEERVNRVDNRVLVWLSCASIFLLILLYNFISVEQLKVMSTIGNFLVRLVETILLLTSTVPIYVIILKADFTSYFTKRHLELLSRTIRFISYASLCIFLFHRSIWAVMATLWPKGSFFQWVYIMIFGVPFIVVFCYGIQRSYDKTMGFITARLS